MKVTEGRGPEMRVQLAAFQACTARRAAWLEE